MIVNYFGNQFLKIQYSDYVIAYNPSNNTKSKFGANLVISSGKHSDFHSIESASYGDQVPFVIDGPGAYEIKEIPVVGVGFKTIYKGQPFFNTSYLLEIEGMRLVFLGVVDNIEVVSAEAREQLGDADIVFVGLGLGLSPAKAYQLAKSFSPSYVVPLGESVADELVLKVFTDEASQANVETFDKWTIKPKDLLGKEAEIIILK